MSRSTPANGPARGSGARMRTPTACCADFPKGTDLARSWAGKLPPSSSIDCSHLSHGSLCCDDRWNPPPHGGARWVVIPTLSRFAPGLPYQGDALWPDGARDGVARPCVGEGLRGDQRLTLDLESRPGRLTERRFGRPAGRQAEVQGSRDQIYHLAAISSHTRLKQRGADESSIVAQLCPCNRRGRCSI